jgi:2-amino-4-hydroxy-6-hydroxymethyldihydropteridine diphosphokinase
MQHRSYIGLGANLPSEAGAPRNTLRAAIQRLSSLGEILKRSGYYRTRPIAYVEQPFFTNAVVELKTTLEPKELLNSLLQIEKEFGRDRSPGLIKGPRTLDLDLLLVDDLEINTSDLVLPHPQLFCRRFVLAPLTEIAPDLRHPVLKRSMAELLAALPSTGENGVDAVQMEQFPSD